MSETPHPDAPLKQPEIGAWFNECGVDFMLYPSPHRIAFESGVPFVMVVHDIQHALQPSFPEVSANGEWQRREYVLRNAARNALLLVAESQTGRDDILSTYGAYGIEPHRVEILPYLPNCTESVDVARARLASVRQHHGLPERYLFYPAQFWPHKNHLRLIEALGLLRTEGLVCPLVLTGSADGLIRQAIMDELRDRIRTLGLERQVQLLGYVSDEVVASLYAGAAALTMPTFFGPTNIPFLEAWAMECPVITSRIRGIVEQVGDAALTVDPANVEQLAGAVRRIWTDAELRQTLVSRGTARLHAYSPSDFRRKLRAILEQAARRLAGAPRWGLQETHR